MRHRGANTCSRKRLAASGVMSGSSEIPARSQRCWAVPGWRRWWVLPICDQRGPAQAHRPSEDPLGLRCTGHRHVVTVGCGGPGYGRGVRSYRIGTLSSDVDARRDQIGDRRDSVGAPIPSVGAQSSDVEAPSSGVETLSSAFEARSSDVEPTSFGIEALSSEFDVPHPLIAASGWKMGRPGWNDPGHRHLPGGGAQAGALP